MLDTTTKRRIDTARDLLVGKVVEELIREAISLHLESLHEHGDPIPEPHTTATLIEV